MPLLRKGSLSTLFDYDYGGKKLFLIDAKTIPGSSGSPVFVKRTTLDYDVDENEIGQNADFQLAGILFGRITQRPTIGTEIVPIPLSKEEHDEKIDINIGSVIKSKVLYDFVHEYLEKNGKLVDWFG